MEIFLIVEENNNKLEKEIINELNAYFWDLLA